jgi:hypothetical protein
VVHRELRLQPARVARERGRHDPRVEDEQVQRPVDVARGEGVDGRGPREVQLLDAHVGQPADGSLRLGEVARGDDHLRARGGEHARGLHADARVAAGDDRGLAVEAEGAHHLARGGLRAEPRRNRVLLRCGHGASQVAGAAPRRRRRVRGEVFRRSAMASRDRPAT